MLKKNNDKTLCIANNFLYIIALIYCVYGVMNRIALGVVNDYFLESSYNYIWLYIAIVVFNIGYIIYQLINKKEILKNRLYNLFLLTFNICIVFNVASSLNLVSFLNYEDVYIVHDSVYVLAISSILILIYNLICSSKFNK